MFLVYDNNSSVFLLRFPGLLFTFSIDFRVEVNKYIELSNLILTYELFFLQIFNSQK